jgi:hypothetical protein
MNSKRRKEKADLPEPQAKTGIGVSASTVQPEISPGDIPTRLKEDICRWKREVEKNKGYFTGKGINPFQEAHEILLSFLNNFDKLAGMKAK